jgi:flagellar hook-associated protein 2
VRATLVRDGAEWRLLLSSEQTGVDRSISLVASAGLDARLESAAMTETVAPANARFSVSGLELSSASNIVDDVLPGVTLNLKALTDSPVELSVGQDEQTARKALNEFVAAYNAVIEQAASLSRFNPETRERAALTGDATLRSIRGALPAALGAATGGAWNAVELGLRSDLTGKISLDATAFEARMLENPAEVLASLRGFGEGLGESVRAYSGPEGLLDNRTQSLKSSLKSLDVQRDQLDRRMEGYEQRLQRQFGALDQMISQMQNTSSFLASRLATLPVPGA